MDGKLNRLKVSQKSNRLDSNGKGGLGGLSSRHQTSMEESEEKKPERLRDLLED